MHARRVIEDDEHLLHAGLRVIRIVRDDAAVPWPGALAADPTGTMMLVVDAARFGSGWPGWQADGHSHVLAPHDILRRDDGHDLLLPPCVERIADFLRRRTDAGDLMAGEAVTLAVSMTRGLMEAGDAADTSTGAWWLTEDGRPVLAVDSGDRVCIDETLARLQELAGAVPEVADAVLAAHDGMAEPRTRRRECTRFETEMFDLAEPAALATSTFGPRRARTSPEPRRIEAQVVADAPRPHALLHALVRHVDADWADLLSRTTTGAWRALRSRERARRPWLVAAGAAATVLIAGLLWPTVPSGPATAETPNGLDGAVSTPPPSEPTPSPSPGAEPHSDVLDSGAHPTDLVAVASELLSARVACAGEPTCLVGVQESPDVAFPAGVIDLPVDGRSLVLLDEFGGAAVLRVEALDASTGPQLVVIVKLGDGWELRDVHDVSQ